MNVHLLYKLETKLLCLNVDNVEKQNDDKFKLSSRWLCIEINGETMPLFYSSDNLNSPTVLNQFCTYIFKDLKVSLIAILFFLKITNLSE
jgi:hypothetical protein